MAQSSRIPSLREDPGLIRRCLPWVSLVAAVVVVIVAVAWLMTPADTSASAPLASDPPADAAAVAVLPPPPRPTPAPELSDATHLSPTLPPVIQRLLAPPRVKAILVDADSHQTLFEHQADEVGAMASLTKMMTVLIALEQVTRRPELTMETLIPVSLAAQQMGGSQLWLQAGAAYPLELMLYGLMLASANDASHAVAEALAPNGEAATFVGMMNFRARELDLPMARFYNPHGMPGDTPDYDNRATPRELARLALVLLRRPEFMTMAGTRQMPFHHTNGQVIQMTNHNRLLGQVPGVTGLKTGFINRSGFCSVISATRGGRTLVAVAMGFDARASRDQFVTELLAWGFRHPALATSLAHHP